LKRLFFALWPDETLRLQCAKVIENIPVGSGRPVKTNNLHVTLLFLGEIDSIQEQCLSKAAAKLSPPCLTLTFDQLSFWTKPEILCLTCSDFNQQLTVFVEKLRVIAAENGVSIADRPYQPHITLARKAQDLVFLRFQPIRWRIEDFCLVQSISRADGVEYRLLGRWV